MAALTEFLVPLAGGSAWAAFLCLFLAQLLGDFWATVFTVHARTLEQAVTPGRWLGRVEGSLRTLTGGMGAAGAVVGGLVAAASSARFSFWVAAAGNLLVFAVLAVPAGPRFGSFRGADWRWPA